MPRQIVREFERLFCERFGVSDAIAVNSGTSALEVALLACDVRGKRVITTPFTFPSTVSAIVHAGGIPVFCDTYRECPLLDSDAVSRALHDKVADVAAIVNVNLFGLCRHETMSAIASRYGVYLIDDNAQCFRPGETPTDNHFGCFSFYCTKTFSTMEGGMVTRGSSSPSNRRLQVLARMYSDPVGNAASGWPVIGHNYRMAPQCALMGLEQLKLHQEQTRTPVHYREGEYYPYVVYELPAFRKYAPERPCVNAERFAARVKENT